MTDEYEVGYGKPPRHTRFKKGQSGNPRGRPAQSKNLETIMQAELDRVVSITEGGKQRKVPVRVALLKRLIAAAFNGNTKSLEIVLKHMQGAAEPFGFTELDGKELLNFARSLEGEMAAADLGGVQNGQN